MTRKHGKSRDQDGVKREVSRRQKSADGKRILKRRSNSKNQLRKKKGLKRKKKYPKGFHPNSQKKWWEKGYCPNPKGRPKKELCITSLVKSYLAEIDDETGLTHAALVAKALVRGSEDLNSTAMKELLARIEGAVKQRMEVEGSSRMEISVGDLARELVRRKRKKKKKK